MVSDIRWYSCFGLGDVVLIGVFIGVVWFVKGGIVGIISCYMKLKDMFVMSVIFVF